MNLTEAILTRRTITKFKPEVPPSSAVQAAAECARWAQNHKLTEPWNVYILGKEAQANVAQLAYDHFLPAEGPEQATARKEKLLATPGFFVITARKSRLDARREQEDYAATCCFAQNLMLHLWVQGIGGKWSTGPITRLPAFCQIIGLEAEHESVVGLFTYGYPSEVPRGVRRRAVEDFVRFVD